MRQPASRRAARAVTRFVLAAAGTAAGAGAQVVFAPGASGATDEAVLFNQPGLVTTGNPVQGVTESSGLVLDFTFPFPGPPLLTTLGAGEPRVSMPGRTFSSLTFRFADPRASFTALDFAINADQVGAITFTAVTTDGEVFTGASFLDAPAINPFGVRALGPMRLREVRYDSPAPYTVDVRRVRVGGVAVVPEPGALALFGAGLVPFVGAAARRAARGAPRGARSRGDTGLAPPPLSAR